MKNFYQFIREDATEGGVFEEVVIASWNKTKLPKTKNIPADAGPKIVKYLESQGITGKTASKLATKGVEVTSEWSKFWYPEKVPPATKTPKTDILIGTNRISLKMGAAQLMSGGPNESKATFYAALKSIPEIDEKVFNVISSKMELLTKGAIAKGQVEGELKKGKDAFLKKANDINNEVKVLMKDVFTNNLNFRRAFVREAITGETKFGTFSSAFAEYVLSSDPSGNSPHLYKSTNSNFLDKVADKTDVTVRFKSTSIKKQGSKTGEYRYWTVVALGVKKLEEEYEQYNGVLLTENIITGIAQRVKNYIVSLFQKVFEWMRQSIQNIIDFFDFEPEIKFNNQINFSEL